MTMFGRRMEVKDFNRIIHQWGGSEIALSQDSNSPK